MMERVYLVQLVFGGERWILYAGSLFIYLLLNAVWQVLIYAY